MAIPCAYCSLLFHEQASQKQWDEHSKRCKPIMIKKIERLQELIDDSIARDRLTDEDLQNIKELRKLKRLLGER